MLPKRKNTKVLCQKSQYRYEILAELTKMLLRRKNTKVLRQKKPISLRDPCGANKNTKVLRQKKPISMLPET